VKIEIYCFCVLHTFYLFVTFNKEIACIVSSEIGLPHVTSFLLESVDAKITTRFSDWWRIVQTTIWRNRIKSWRWSFIQIRIKRPVQRKRLKVWSKIRQRLLTKAASFVSLLDFNFDAYFSVSSPWLYMWLISIIQSIFISGLEPMEQ